MLWIRGIDVAFYPISYVEKPARNGPLVLKENSGQIYQTFASEILDLNFLSLQVDGSWLVTTIAKGGIA